MEGLFVKHSAQGRAAAVGKRDGIDEVFSRSSADIHARYVSLIGRGLRNRWRTV